MLHPSIRPVKDAVKGARKPFKGVLRFLQGVSRAGIR
jgi:hypothetical protein